MITTFKSHLALTHVKKYLPDNPIVVEAGAFEGKETLHMSTLWPKGTMHAFEPVPEIFEKLAANTVHMPNVIRYPLALSNTTGTATLYISEKPNKPDIASQGNSLLKPKERLKLSPLVFPTTLEVPTITLDDWQKKYNISHVDLLWLDLQGCELNVLKSCPNIMNHVKVVYTEVEFVEAYEGQYLYPDVVAWLGQQGFTMVGRNFPDNPTWFFGNALFVRK
ncbi:MAG: FkbM family methyltransferase [Candidatus Dependentiae bacterium]|nr:FkbM family methyltransferase [Candidatus Dependentiae bacterium]